jgi:uncharacterized membrane protein YhfC
MTTSASQTVSSLSILFMAFTLLVSFGVPIGLAIWAKLKYKKAFSFIPLLLGAAAFFVFQMVIRINILNLLPMISGYKDYVNHHIWLYAILLCLSAGLFEEPARFLVFSLLKKRRSYADGLSYGIGHGGIEAILLVGITYINNIFYAVMINSGSFGKMVESLPAAYQSQMLAVQTQLTSLSPDLFAVGGVERIFTVCIQIAFSLLVLRGFAVNRKWLYLVLATILHALVDFIAVTMQILKCNMWLIEGVIFVEAVLAVGYIIWLARTWQTEEKVPEGLINAEQ